jgi:hypothetical protein
VDKVAELAKEEFERTLERQFVKGWEKYGVELTTFNGRNPFVDAMEELVDAFQYVTQASMEAKEIAKLLLFFAITEGFWEEFSLPLRKKLIDLGGLTNTTSSINTLAPKRGEDGKVSC